MALATVSESYLIDTIQALSNKHTISQAEMTRKGTTTTKYFAGNHHVATEQVPKVAKPSYLVNVSLCNQLVGK